MDTKPEATTNWMTLIRQSVSREAAAHDVEELAQMETCPEDWMHFVHENIDWIPFEKSVQTMVQNNQESRLQYWATRSWDSE